MISSLTWDQSNLWARSKPDSLNPSRLSSCLNRSIIASAKLEDLKGGEGDYNAERLRALLNGQRDAYRDIVLFGAGAAQVIAGKVDNITEGVAKAAEAIDTGAAKDALKQLVAVTNK